MAREARAITASLPHVTLRCLPALLHNRPERIAPAVRSAILAARTDGFARVFVAYAECGTGGALDELLRFEHVERLAGPHCYATFTGVDAFVAAGDADMRSFFLTDFLARSFAALVVEPLGLDRHPELRDLYFGQYERVVHLAQTSDAAVDQMARAAADRLGLAFERRWTGYGNLRPALLAAVS